MVTASAIQISEIKYDGDDIYWLEFRANDSGRQLVVRYSLDGAITDITPPGFNVRNRVHEYGGGAYLVYKGVVTFCNYLDQRIYNQIPGKEPQAITPDNQNRYADLIMDKQRQRLICIREQHDDNGRDVTNSMTAIPLDGDSPIEVLQEGNDFYSNPRISPDGKQLCWLTWNHPNMPWDGCELWIGSFNKFGKLINIRLIAGGLNESIFQPEWTPAGDLVFISDRSGWWIPYLCKDERITPLTDLQAEFGLPQWVFGISTYGFSDSDQLICSYTKAGQNYLASLNTNTNSLKNIPTSYVEHSSLIVKHGNLLFVGGSTDHPAELVVLDLRSGTRRVLRQTGTNQIERSFISTPQEIEFTSQKHLKAYGNFYPPANSNNTGPNGEKPPLIVMIHGGPTSSASLTFNLKIQFWTSRGFAVLDVNYSGSSGYGRQYRQRLNGKWGVIDVEDCIQGAKYLASQRLVDGKQMSITGGSAGGYTALCALTFHSTFTAGVSRYGIGSLETLAIDTHKFESHYLERLVGPYTEASELYRQRSPIHFIEKINAPILLLQGSEDKVVPPIQSERMHQALTEKGLPVAYLLFEGEQHGFRKAENIKRALEVELYFYSRIFGFPLADIIEPIEINNLRQAG